MKNNMKKLLSLLLATLCLGSLSVNAFAEDGSFTGDTMSVNNLAAYYKVAHLKDYTDVSGVKLSWSVPVLKYTNTDVREWNNTTLKWEQHYDHENAQEVTFTLTNRGSYAVKANVSFTPVIADSASVDFGSTNDPTLATIVKADHTLNTEDGKTAEQYVTDNCSAAISGTVSLNADKLTATSGKLGTYTVSIRNTKHTVTVSYYKNEGDASKTTETITVADDTKISCNGSTITIGSTTYTTQIPSDSSFDYWLCANAKIEDDITVNSDLVIDAIFAT